MKEAIISANESGSVSVSFVDSPIPSPGPDDVVIKVIVSGSNPKDWKYPLWRKKDHNSGDDIAGTVYAVGQNVTEFHIGDRVAAFHKMGEPHGSFAEYALAPAITTFHIPSKTTFEEAATIPLAAMTAVVGLFQRLGLPEPWKQGREDGKGGETAGPLLVYGAASAVGAFVIQLAKHANIGPIIAVAGRGIPFVQSLLGKEDTVVDYRKGDENLVTEIKAALKGQKLRYTFDAISEKGSYVNASEAMEGGKITLVLPGKEEIPSSIEQSLTMVGDSYGKQTDLGFAWFRLFTKGLQEGWLKPHPVEVVKGGLHGVEQGLHDLKNGKNSGLKYVFRIADTPGVKL
ncbi:hypothetical protein MMC10_004052 [Thelotrema lepadinum]|nr:hypothetical protein [Thelotrema lepadinum]